LQLILLLVAIRIYAVSPNKLQEACYLVRVMDINPHSLINAMDLSLSIDPIKKFRFRPANKNYPLAINMFPKIRIWGYRFFLTIYNDEGDVFFVSFGPITQNTEIIRYLTPIDIFSTGDFNRVELGRFQFNMVEKKQDLRIAFLMFIPFFHGEKCSPCMTEGRHAAHGTLSPDISISSSLGMFSIDTSHRYNDIEYSGNGIYIKARVVSDAKPHVINNIFSKYVKKFVRTRHIKQYKDIKGRLFSTKAMNRKAS
jgi:hypothetical protein